MREKLRKIPKALKKQILLRYLSGVLIFILYDILIADSRNIYISLPVIIISVFLITNGSILLYNCVAEEYMCVSGICQSVCKTRFLRQIKYFTMLCDVKTVKVYPHIQIKDIKVGVEIKIYLSDKTSVYANDTEYVILSYYAVEAGNEVK